MTQDALILVVDDDPAIGKLLRLVLEQSGYRIHIVTTGEQALSYAAAHPPDLAILDVMLPGIDGYTLCRRLRDLRQTSLTPILMLTAQSDIRDKLAGFNAGADDYLTKPFEPQELAFRVKALLARSQGVSGATPKPAQRGHLVSVFGAKGGVGKTTLAVNLAVALARNQNSRVALLDADFSFGDVGAHLNLAPSRTILDLITRADDLDDQVLSKVLIRHESNVQVLLSPYRPEDAERIEPEALKRVLEILTDTYDFVLADCAVNYDERTLSLLERSDLIVMVLTPEIGPVKNTTTFLDLAAQMGIVLGKIQLVLNRADSAVGIAAREIENALQKPIPLRLMSGGRPVVMSVNRGVPILMEQPQHPFAQQVTRIAEVIRTQVTH